MAASIVFRHSNANHNPCMEVNALAATIYDPHTVLSVDILERWYRAEPHIFWLAYNREKTLVGYLSLVPLCEEQYQLIFSTNFDERTITAADVLPFELARHFLLSSIAIHPAYRNSTTASTSAHPNLMHISRELRANMLTDLFKRIIANVAPNTTTLCTINAACIAGEAITAQGEYMLQSLGLRFHSETRPGNKVYCGEVHPDSRIPVLEVA